MDKRTTKQAIFFYGSGLLAVAAAFKARRSVAARRYAPLIFDPNQRPPSFSMMQDAVQAVSNATMLSVSSFTFGLATVCFVGDISSITEFGTMMKKKLGGEEKQRELEKMQVPEDVKELEQKLSKSLS